MRRTGFYSGWPWNKNNDIHVAPSTEDNMISLPDSPTVAWHTLAIEAVCDRHRSDLMANPSLEDVLAVDGWSRRAVREAANQRQAKAPAALPATVPPARMKPAN